MEYPKIQSLWKRHGFDREGTNPTQRSKKIGPLIVGEYSQPEFQNIKNWYVEEKVDGTNIRVIYKDGEVRYAGRTKEAQIPSLLLEYLQDTFTPCILRRFFPNEDEERRPHVVLFGEGYGHNIQTAGKFYRTSPGFILFDVWVGGWWLTRESMQETAKKLSIPHCPYLGVMSEEEAIKVVKSKPISLCSERPHTMEGVMCRSDPLMLFRNGKPVMWKLKCSDF